MDAKLFEERFRDKCNKNKKKLFLLMRVQNNYEESFKSLRFDESYKRNHVIATYFANLSLQIDPVWLPLKMCVKPACALCVM